MWGTTDPIFTFYDDIGDKNQRGKLKGGAREGGTTDTFAKQVLLPFEGVMRECFVSTGPPLSCLLQMLTKPQPSKGLTPTNSFFWR